MRVSGRVVVAVGCLAAGLAAMAQTGWTQSYETPTTARAIDLVPKDKISGPHYKLRPTVPYDGYMYRFAVDSDYGPFEVTGEGALRKLMGEIRAITALRATKNTKVYTEGLKKSSAAPLNFAKGLVTNPVDTLSGIPKGTYQIMENVGEAVTTTRNPAQDSRTQELVKFSSWKRDHAHRLGVDPYSRNAALQKELNSVAWAATAGDWTTSIVLMPVGGPAVSAVSGMRMSDSVKNALKEEPPPRLRILSEGKLKAMGVPDELSKQFLDQPHYTPTQSTILVEALNGLGDAKGRDEFLRVAVAAEDEVMSTFFTEAAQILRGVHDKGTPISALRPLGKRLIMAQTADGTVIPLPMDRVIWTERVDQVSAALKDGAPAKVQLWLTGTISPAARSQLQARGVEVVERARERVTILDF